MAKSKIENHSLISMLAQARVKIFQTANADGDRTLTNFEMDYVNAANFLIANTPAHTRKEVAIQAEVAAEIVDCHCDGNDGSPWSESLNAAVRSMSAVLAPRRSAA